MLAEGGNKMTNEWWSDLTTEQIDWLKSNRVPTQLLTKEEWKIFDSIPRDLVRIFCPIRNRWVNEEGEWMSAAPWIAYRLRPGWQRPEKKPDWEWEYCKVEWQGSEWRVHHSTGWLPLDCAIRYNFGGVEYEEWPGRWYPLGTMKYKPYDTADWEADMCQPHRIIAIPAIPKRVRFWRGSDE
jgi:hypothetical protein